MVKCAPTPGIVRVIAYFATSGRRKLKESVLILHEKKMVLVRMVLRSSKRLSFLVEV
jgi:hypothetical protein